LPNFRSTFCNKSRLSEAGRSAQNPRHSGSNKYINLRNVAIGVVVLLLGAPFYGAFYAGQKATEEQRSRKACAAHSPDMQEIAGTVRLAGSNYFFVADGLWRHLLIRCNPSAGKRGCSDASPAQKILEKSVGANVTASLCAGEIARFRIADQWYER